MIRKAVDLRPSDGYIVDSLGWAYYRLGKFDDAVRELERAVSLKPDDPVLNDHLGDAYWRVGRQLEATFQWSHARDMKPEPDVLASVQKKLAEGPAAGRGQDRAGIRPRQRSSLPAPTAAERRRRHADRKADESEPRAGSLRAQPVERQRLTSAVSQPPTRCSPASRSGRSPPTSSATAALPRDPRPQPAAAGRSRPDRARAGTEAAGTSELSSQPDAIQRRSGFAAVPVPAVSAGAQLDARRMPL